MPADTGIILGIAAYDGNVIPGKYFGAGAGIALHRGNLCTLRSAFDPVQCAALIGPRERELVSASGAGTYREACTMVAVSVSLWRLGVTYQIEKPTDTYRTHIIHATPA
jgi:hypothetical protein